MGVTVNIWTENDSFPSTRAGGIYRVIDQTMNDHPTKERIRAVIALGESKDPRAVRPLIDCCRDKNSEIRWHAIEGLENIRSGRAVEVLIERMQDTSEMAETRARAALALGTIGSMSAIIGLRETLMTESSGPSLQSLIKGILGHIVEH